LEELNDIIWRVTISIASQELCCMSRNIFGMCEGCLKVGEKVGALTLFCEIREIELQGKDGQ
jgi:hypothetical protein